MPPFVLGDLLGLLIMCVTSAVLGGVVGAAVTYAFALRKLREELAQQSMAMRTPARPYGTIPAPGTGKRYGPARVAPEDGAMAADSEGSPWTETLMMLQTWSITVMAWTVIGRWFRPRLDLSPGSLLLLFGIFTLVQFAIVFIMKFLWGQRL